MMPRRVDRPEPCFRKMTLVKGGPLVPARIHRTCHCTIHGSKAHEQRDTCDRSRPLKAEINGRPADVDRVWLGGEDIDQAEYNYWVAKRAHYEEHEPEHPEANPYEPYNWLTHPTPFEDAP